MTQNESEGQAGEYEYQTYLSEGEGTASEEWRQDRSLNTESPRLHAALSGSLDSLRSSSGGDADVRSGPNPHHLTTQSAVSQGTTSICTAGSLYRRSSVTSVRHRCLSNSSRLDPVLVLSANLWRRSLTSDSAIIAVAVPDPGF